MLWTRSSEPAAQKLAPSQVFRFTRGSRILLEQVIEPKMGETGLKSSGLYCFLRNTDLGCKFPTLFPSRLHMLSKRLGAPTRQIPEGSSVALNCDRIRTSCVSAACIRYTHTSHDMLYLRSRATSGGQLDRTMRPPTTFIPQYTHHKRHLLRSLVPLCDDGQQTKP